MKTRITRGTLAAFATAAALATLTWGLAAGPATAAGSACEKQADEKKLAGAARTSFVTKCEKDAGGGGAATACTKQADEKKLAGAARTSFVTKCEKDAAGAGSAAAACEKSAADKKLAGAAHDSHVKKCMEDAAAKK